MKLKNSIMGLLLFFSLFPLVVFGGFSICETNKKIDKMTDCNLEAISQNQILDIKDFCNDRKSEMEIIANYSLIQDAVLCSLGEGGEADDRDYVDGLLKEHKKYDSYAASISVLDKDFKVVGSSENYEIYEISQFKSVNERFRTGEFIIGNSYERDTDDGVKKLVPAYLGIYDGQRLIGFVSEELDTRYFDDLRMNMGSLADGTFYLIDGNGEIITAGDSKHESLTQFVTDVSERKEFQKAWDAIDHEANPSGKLYYTYKGQQYITYYSDVNNTDWGIRITENLSEQKKDTKSYSMLIGMVMIVLVLSVGIVQYFLTDKVLKPIDNMIDVLLQTRITQNYSLRIPKTKTYEMGKLADEINSLLGYIENEDIHEKAKQKQLVRIAEADPLTGIDNKKTIELKMRSMLSHAGENGKQISIGFLDIDDFRDYNTKYGHQEGDEVICFVANLINKNIRGNCGRNGGDEFVFCYEGNLELDEMKLNLDRLMKLLNEGYSSDTVKERIHIPCSIGVVTTTKTDRYTYEELIKVADDAMYESKNKGKNQYNIIRL